MSTFFRLVFLLQTVIPHAVPFRLSRNIYYSYFVGHSLLNLMSACARDFYTVLYITFTTPCVVSPLKQSTVGYYGVKYDWEWNCFKPALLMTNGQKTKEAEVRAALRAIADDSRTLQLSFVTPLIFSSDSLRRSEAQQARGWSKRRWKVYRRK